MTRRRHLVLAALCLAPLGALLLAGATALLLAVVGSGAGCSTGSAADPANAIVLGPPGTGQLVGATEYGGPGDPASGTVGARSDSLLAHPDSYAELGGLTWATARAMGGLAYMTPLRITWSGRSAVAYKRDFGFGGSPIEGHPRAIDLWWQLAGRLGIPYDAGQWSGTVRVERAPATGAAALLAQTPAADELSGGAAADPAACAPALPGILPLAPGDRARRLPDGTAAAPADAPPAVRAMIAAGNQIVGRPYLFGGGHGRPLSELSSSYDCSSSVEHLLYAARLIPVDFTVPSGVLESFGEPGPGRWVTLYASAEHVFMYVAGLRWDTHNAAGRGDGAFEIGWHPLVRDAGGFVARHPQGL